MSAVLALACVCGSHLRDAAAEGLEHPAAQPLELWSRTSSGLGALEPRCERAVRWVWRMQETIDPWAKPATPCETSTPASFDARALEIVDPWPSRRGGPWDAAREIVDPWAPARH